MNDESAGGGQDRALREWLLLLLRIAITRAPADRAAPMAMADQLDRAGPHRPPGSGFFGRTTTELCDAIFTPESDASRATLRRHIERIEDDRLRRAFRGAMDLQETERPRRKAHGRNERRDLWKGLPQRAFTRGRL